MLKICQAIYSDSYSTVVDIEFEDIEIKKKKDKLISFS